MSRATAISIRLTPTEYQTLLDALRTYKDALRCYLNQDFSDLLVVTSISSIPTQRDRTDALLRTIGPG